MNTLYDVVVIGGGIVGTATAMTLQRDYKLSTVLIEAEEVLAKHQTGNNSGVIHSGLYYKPGSLKAQNCVKGRELLYEFCNEHNIKYDRCGKLVVAVSNDEIPALNDLEERGKANGLKGLKRLRQEELKEYEPHVKGVAGLYVSETGIVDYKQVTEAYGDMIIRYGGEVRNNCKFTELRRENGNHILLTNKNEIKAKILVNCAGLYSDKVAKKCGVKPNLMIIPFRGEYYNIVKDREFLIKNLVYPVPDTKFPFLGVHFTRMINGGVEAGPNAVLAFKREGYKQTDFSISELLNMGIYSGFWRMARKHYRMGFNEFRRSFSKNLFLAALQKLVPDIMYEDIYRAGAGVRAQALEPSGKLVDDFRIIENEKMVHVLNAPSPAATASLSIGKTIAEIVSSKFKAQVNHKSFDPVD